MAARGIAFLLMLLAALVSPAESPRAQSGEAAAPRGEPTPFNVLVADWNGDLDLLERLLDIVEVDAREANRIKRDLADLITEATTARNEARVRVAELEARLDALGPPPEGPDALPEPDAVANERNRLNLALGDARSQVSLAELAITRATALEVATGAAQRDQLVGSLLRQGPLPFDPDSLAQAPVDYGRFLAGIAGIASDWWSGLRAEDRFFTGIAPALTVIVIVFGAAWWVRRFILRRFGPHPVDEDPHYGRRLVAAVADGVAQGIVPAAILGIIYVRATTEGAAIYGDFGDLIALAAALMIVFVLSTALPHAALAPDDPKWRLTSLPAEKGRRIFSLIWPLALLFCIDELVVRAASGIEPLKGLLSEGFLSVWTFSFNIAQGLLLLTLLRPSLWRADRDDDADARREEGDLADDESEEPPRRGGLGGPFWRAVHAVLVVGTLIGMAAPAIGYTALGNYLMNNLVGSAIVISVLYILRGLFREAVGIAASSAIARDRLALPHETRSRAKWLLRFVLDVGIVVLGAAVIAPSWGVSDTDLWRWARGILDGVTVGSVTISPMEILLGVFVFFATLALIRALRRQLTERILPETGVEESVRHSIGAGIGYVGFVVAAALAVAVAGVDLTNIALIAGALSVGIGFGLQNIVNNFVSGLILLIERPIKVGDWVVVGPNEGFVKQINMRATEIETWRKASVIVPNADLLSSALTNWTHKDKIGRVDVPFGVALDADLDKVERILMEIMRAHPRCRRFPEPVVLIMGIGDNRIEMEARLFTSDILWVLWIASDIRKDFLRRFKEEGIVIPPPQRIVHMGAPEKGTDFALSGEGGKPSGTGA
jgi:potassium efflux system protein